MCAVAGNGQVCSGHGNCVATIDGNPACQCFAGAGYTGSDCSSCAFGFYDDGTGSCQFMAASPTQATVVVTTSESIVSLNEGEVGHIVLRASAQVDWSARVLVAQAADADASDCQVELETEQEATAGAFDYTFVVRAVADGVVEQDQTCTVSLASADAAVVLLKDFTTFPVLVHDHDTADVTIDSLEFCAEGTDCPFTVTLSAPVEGADVKLFVRSIDLTATSVAGPHRDFTMVAAVLQFDAGVTTVSEVVQTLQDAVVESEFELYGLSIAVQEPGQWYVSRLVMPHSAGTPHAIVTIVDDDGKLGCVGVRVRDRV